MKKMTLAGIASVPIGAAVILFLLVYAYSDWAAGRRLACVLLCLCLPSWAVVSSVLNIASVFREQSLKRTTMVCIASFPVGIALLVSVPFLGLWEAGSLLLGLLLGAILPVSIAAAPVLVIVAVWREPSRTGRLLIIGGVALWLGCAAVLLSLYGGAGYLF